MHGDDRGAFGVPDDEDGDDGPLRGWVPPDDRLWLHPSERAAAAAAGRLAGPAAAPGRPPGRGPWVIGGLTVCVVIALVLTGMVAATSTEAGRAGPVPDAFPGVPTTEVGLSRLTTPHQMVQLASTVQDSTVALLVDTGHGIRVGTAVVAEAGGILVALQPTVVGARAVTAVEPDGTRQAAVQVGGDPATGIVVLRIADDLPAAAFTTGDPVTGSYAVAMSEEARSTGGAPIAKLYAGTVLYAGLATGDGPSTGFCATAIAAPLSVGDLGSPLVEPSGAVAGVLDAVEGTGGDRTAVFLPGELVRDVAAQIVSHGSVDHGVLGAGVADTGSAGTQSFLAGALVVDIVAGSSADQAGIRSGDRIVSVDGGEVRSVAELTTRLYADPPGTELPVVLVRAGTELNTTVTLGDS